MDKINLRVVEWQPEAGEFRDWSGVDGIYTVSASGKLSLPFVGSINVAGETAASLSELLETEFAKKLGIVNQLTASIEIAEYRPILVGGDVQSPGRYPYEPGMTIRQVLILAGGYPRLEDGSGALLRAFIDARTDYDVLTREKNRLNARRTRLQAQQDGKDSITTPPALAGQHDAAEIMAGERQIFEAEQTQHQLQLRSLKDLKDLLGREIASINKKGVTQQEELRLLHEELDTVGGLKDKGFATNSNILVLKQQIADLESRLLDVDLARMSADQGITKASQEEIALQNDRATTLAKDMNETLDALRQTNIKISSDQDMADALLERSRSLRSSFAGEDVTASFKIFRKEAGAWTSLSATEDTALQPGDIVETKLILPTVGSND